MEKIKQNWIIILFSLLLFGGLFYWWEWRPAHIRQECSWVKRSSEQPAKTWYEPEKNPDKYQFCIHRRGL